MKEIGFLGLAWKVLTVARQSKAFPRSNYHVGKVAHLVRFRLFLRRFRIYVRCALPASKTVILFLSTTIHWARDTVVDIFDSLCKFDVNVVPVDGLSDIAVIRDSCRAFQPYRRKQEVSRCEMNESSFHMKPNLCMKGITFGFYLGKLPRSYY